MALSSQSKIGFARFHAIQIIDVTGETPIALAKEQVKLSNLSNIYGQVAEDHIEANQRVMAQGVIF